MVILKYGIQRSLLLFQYVLRHRLVGKMCSISSFVSFLTFFLCLIIISDSTKISKVTKFFDLTVQFNFTPYAFILYSYMLRVFFQFEHNDKIFPWKRNIDDNRSESPSDSTPCKIAIGTVSFLRTRIFHFVKFDTIEIIENDL